MGVEERKNRVSTSRRNGGATISSRATLVKLEPQQGISSESNVKVLYLGENIDTIHVYLKAGEVLVVPYIIRVPR